MANSPARLDNQAECPLCVDLDGTLIRTDLLYESVAILARRSPATLLALPAWLAGGRGRLKREVARRVEIRPELLPYNEELLGYLRQEKSQGRKLILVTASDQALATTVADHLGIFDEVVGSTPDRNLKGRNKARYLVERFGSKQFDYIGDSRADLPVWREARGGAVVSSSNQLFRAAQLAAGSVRQILPQRPSIRTWIRAIRVHQWVKNVLVFVPLILAHKIFAPEVLFAAVRAFFAFSLCASVVYVINDILDLDADRSHPRKKLRPIASGAISIPTALLCVPVFLVIAAALSASLPVEFSLILAGYVLLTFGYSLLFKQIVLVDIVLLAALYAIRLLAGGAAEGVAVSSWLVVFAMFFFFSLACVKRYSELFGLRLANQEHSTGRGYRAADLEQIGVFGAASGYLSVLVMSLYVNSTEVTALYSNPGTLWLLCPVLLYWVSRVWLIAHRGEMHDDPIVFALTDKVSYIVGLITVAVILLAL